MKSLAKTIVFSFLIITVALFFSFGTINAQTTYPGVFGLTSVNNLGISPLNTYPWSFGTTSITNYGTYPYFGSYTNSPYLYYGNILLGGYYPGSGISGYLPGVGADLGYSNIFKALQYYQYLSYAYQFYMIARSTPMFYMNDIVADYIGSSLYSYANNYNLSPQEAIISFIQQNLL
ncbi:MAG: hypothetical protein ACMUIU_03815 [bacterium]